MLGVLAAAAQAALGQTAPEARVVATITGSANQVETRRDSGNDSSGLVLQVRPGVTVTSRSGRIRGALSYSADLQHDSASARNFDVAHNLDARFTAEVIENRFFIDTTAQIGRRSVSAFGVQTAPSSTRDERNQEDVYSGTLRPYLRGTLGNLASYNAAIYRTASRTSTSKLGDVDETGASLALASLGSGLFGWGLNGSHSRTEFVSGRATVGERVFASLFLRPDVDWNLSLRAGQESTDVGNLQKRSYANWGAGVRWTPSPRTSVSVDLDERYFGRSWQVLVEHRLARSAFRLSSSRGASSTNTSGVDGSGITAYQLVEPLFAAQTDPALREIAVLQYLRFLGVKDPYAQLPGGSLGNAVSLQTRTDLGWTFSGQRLTLALQTFVLANRILDTQTPQLGDGSVRQRGLLASAGWRLSPSAGVNVSVSYLQTLSTATNPGNDLSSIALGLTEQLGERTTASANVRYSAQSGGPDPYRELAVGAAISYRF